jgi:hypothetical protein
LEFSDVYARIRQGLQDHDNLLIEQGTTELLSLAPLVKILAEDLIEILACLKEIVEELFPSVTERLGNFAQKMGEMLERRGFEEILSGFPQTFADEHLQCIFNNIQEMHEQFLSNFVNLMPNVQDIFVDYLKSGMPLTPERYETHFPKLLDYFETQPIRRLEKLPDILDCGGNLFPGEAIREILERFFSIANNSSPEKILHVSYLGDFLMQFLDIYPESGAQDISRFISLLTHRELYFRTCALDVLKIVTQARVEIMVPHFIQLYQVLLQLDEKLLSGLILTIRDL